MRDSPVVRLLAVSALTALATLGMPLAQAVSPPPIDGQRLPQPAAPSPAQPTVQREVCDAVSANPGEPGHGHDQLADLDLPRVWQLTRGAGQRVAIIDTGVARHPRLPNLVPGGDYVSTGDGTQDCDAHGTVVAGILSGVAPDVTLISIRQSSAKFGPADRSGAGVGDVDTMARAVRTAADLGASVINISSVACVPAATPLDDRALGAALAYAVDVKNAVVVAPAGNTGGAARCPAQQPNATWETVRVAVSPAWYDDYVLTVGSVNTEGAPSAFTLAGPWVDVAATGEGVSVFWVGPAVGHELRRAGCQWTGRADPCSVPELDRAAGEAADRVDRASPAARMGSVRRRWHGRRTGRGQHRLDPVSHVRAAHPTGGDRRPTAIRAVEAVGCSRTRGRVTRGGDRPSRAGAGAGFAAARGSSKTPQHRPGRLTRSPGSVPVPPVTPPAWARAPTAVRRPTRGCAPPRRHGSRIAPRCR